MLGVLLAAAFIGCPDREVLEALTHKEDIYLGEIHGTNEVPQLVACLVDFAVTNTSEPVIVSLELPSSAASSKDRFWAGQDGRSSAAMHKLVAKLVKLERRGRIRIDWQYGAGPLVMGPKFDERTGKNLRVLAQQGFLIAYGGNFHNMMKSPDYAPTLIPAGVYAGPGIQRVRIEGLERGTAWFCTGPSDCHARDVAASPIVGRKLHTLISATSYGHDSAFFVKRFTASPPEMAQKPLTNTSDR